MSRRIATRALPLLLAGLLLCPGSAHADTTALMALADRIAGEVARLRGLPILRPIRRGVLDRDQLLTRIQALVAKQYRPEEIRHEGDVLKRLGLIPADMRYQETVYALLREQVAGFYDPHSKRLYIASWIPPDMQEPTLAHEIEHALQDQHFQIGRLLKRQPGESDRQAAISALCEGDGVALMIDYLLRGTGRDFTSQPNLAQQMRAQAGGGDDQPLLRDAPRALREALLFPYVSGLAFVQALRRTGPYRVVDQAFRAPPDSTEQILHPERYLTRDPPIAVTLADSRVLGSTHRAVYRETLGELSARLYLEETVADRASAAAAGWGGDRMILYERRGAPSPPPLDALALLSRSRWDTERDAQEFVATATTALERRFRSGAALAVTGGIGRRIGPGLASGLARRGADVAWAEGVPEERLAAVLSETLGD